MPDGACARFAGVAPGGSTVVVLDANPLLAGDAPLGLVDAAHPGDPAVEVDLTALSDTDPDGTESPLRGLAGTEAFGLTITVDGVVLLTDGPRAVVALELG